MLNINENTSLLSNPMDISPPIETTTNSLDITEKKPDKEQNISLSSSTTERVRLLFLSKLNKLP